MPPDFQNATVVFYEGGWRLLVPLVLVGSLLWWFTANNSELRQRCGAILITGAVICLAATCAFLSYEIIRVYFRPQPEIAMNDEGMWCRSWGNFWMPWSDVTGMTLHSSGIRFHTYTAIFEFKPETVGNYPWANRTANVPQASLAHCNVQGLDHSEEDIFREIKRTYRNVVH
jgi:hypothetical protein